jgi:hypothetical protein
VTEEESVDVCGGMSGTCCVVVIFRFWFGDSDVYIVTPNTTSWLFLYIFFRLPKNRGGLDSLRDGNGSEFRRFESSEYC